MRSSYLIPAAASVLAVVFSCASPGKPLRLSDHFDGERFFNPGAPAREIGFSDMAKFREAREKSVWPERVETKTEFRPAEDLRPGEAAVTFVNHSAVLIQLPGLAVLTDPIWSDRASPVSWTGPKRVREPGIPFERLPWIDLVLVSHNHYDHLDAGTLERLAGKFSPDALVPLGDGSLVRGFGIENVRELDWWEEVEVAPGTTVVFAPALHWSRRGLFDRNKSLWGSFLVRSGGRLVYFGGDSGYAGHFKEIRKRYGPVDLAFLPVGAYEPRWFMKDMHMNPADAVQAHLDLGARKSVGIHFGTFQMAAEDFDRPGKDLAEAGRAAGLTGDAFVLLEEGRTARFELSPPSPVRRHPFTAGAQAGAAGRQGL